MKLSRWFRSDNPVLSEAGPDDAPAISQLHGTAFRRGWSEDECERLLLERNVLAHRVTIADQLVGFVMSRLFVPEAEILSIAVAALVAGALMARLERKQTRLNAQKVGQA